MFHQLFERNAEVYSILNIPVPVLKGVNDECVQLLSDPQNGLIASLCRQSTANGRPELCLNSFKQHYKKDPCLGSKTIFGENVARFTIQHFTNTVAYSPLEFGIRTSETLCADFMSLFGARDKTSMSDAPTNSLVTKLFSQKTIITEKHPKSAHIISGKQSAKPHRSPSVKRTSANVNEVTTPINTTANIMTTNKAGQLEEGIQDLITTLSTTKNWYIYCLRSNDLLLPNSCDAKKLTFQIKMFNIMTLVIRAKYEYTIQMDLQEFCDRYVDLIHATSVDLDAELRTKWLALQDAFHWNEKMMILGDEKVTPVHQIVISL